MQTQITHTFKTVKIAIAMCVFVLTVGIFSPVTAQAADLFSDYSSTYTPGYSSTYTPSYSSTYSPSYSSTYTPSYSSTYTPSYSSTYTPSYSSTYTPSYNSTYTPSYNSTYTPSYSSTYTPDYSSTYTPTYSYPSYSYETPSYYPSIGYYYGGGNYYGNNGCTSNCGNNNGCTHDCNPKPEKPRDVCPNLSGTQTYVPDGYELKNGKCKEVKEHYSYNPPVYHNNTPSQPYITLSQVPYTGLDLDSLGPVGKAVFYSFFVLAAFLAIYIVKTVFTYRAIKRG